jgi:hypothetical protein
MGYNIRFCYDDAMNSVMAAIKGYILSIHHIEMSDDILKPNTIDYCIQLHKICFNLQ